jgi:hypothetical protein
MKLLLFIFIFPSTLLASNLEVCNSLIDHGITNITKKATAKHTKAYKWHSNCGVDFSSSSDNSVRKAAVSVFGYGSGSAEGNTQQLRVRLKTWCDQNAEFASNKETLAEEARLIAKPSLDAWNQCQLIAKKDIEITTQIQGEFDQFITFTVDSTSDADHKFYGVRQTGYSCEVKGLEGAEVAVNNIESALNSETLFAITSPSIKNSNIHVFCSRNNPEKTEVAGVGKIKYEEGNVTIMTSGPALPVTLPKRVDTYYVTPPKSILAFVSDCPEGWESYSNANGRFIVGAGQGAGLSNRPMLSTGGTENHLLTIAEMPNHAHKESVTTFAHRSGPEGITGEWRHDRAVRFTRQEPATSAVGGGASHNNIPPFIALNYCVRKD